MLRNMEMTGANANAGKWLQVVGWGIEWGDEPTYSSPVFHRGIILEDFHWSLYSRFTSKQAEKEFTSCALVEVVLITEEGAPPGQHWRSTGRMRTHANLPEFTHFLCRDERLAWLRRNKPLSVSQLADRALVLLGKLNKSDWFRSAVPAGCRDLAELESMVQSLPEAEKRRNARRPASRGKCPATPLIL